MRTFAMASMLLSILMLGTDAARLRLGVLNTATEGAERIAGFIPSISAWPRFGEMVEFCRRNSFEDPYWTGRTTYRRYRRG